MSDQDDEIILSELNDDELVEQMFDDLYDGLKEEIEEATNILLERDWQPERYPDQGSCCRHDNRWQRLPRRDSLRARGPLGRQRDEGRHDHSQAALGRNRRAAHG